ncbi:MAG: hypothetical protein KAJ07_00770 [Planctomycetes bacterium]|nr:hypothetical protein [Planctomycetota bacterium]
MKPIRSLNIYILIFCCVLLLCCVSCDKTDSGELSDRTRLTRTIERGPLSVTIVLDSDHVTITETLSVQLVATSADGYKVRFPELDSPENAIDDLDLIETARSDDKLDENNNVISTIRYRFEPFATGNLQLPPMSVVFYAPDDPEKKTEIVTEPVDIQIDPVLDMAEDAGPQLADIEDVMKIPVSLTLIWLAVAALVIIIAIVAYLLWKKKNAPVEVVRAFKSAHQLAFEKLHQLLAQNLLSQGKIKLFYIGISNVLRYYIEHRFNINAPDQTTEEFLAELSSANTLSMTDKDYLTEVMHHCDLVKFARHDPSSEDNDKTVRIVKDFIDKTASADCQVDITDAQQQGGL